MKSNIRNFLLKLNSLILALFLVFPSQIMASEALNKKDKSYNESSSIMGLQDKSEGDQNSGPIDKANASTLIKSEPSFDESADYIIEKSASLSKTTSTITYKLIFKAKNPGQDNEAKDYVFANFATNTNTDQSELKVDKVNILNENGMEEESEFSQNAPSIFDHDSNLSTIGIKTANPENGLVYYLSAKLDEDTIAKIDKGDYSPIFALDMVISNAYKAPLYQNRYKLSVDFKEGESTPYLKEAEENSLVKGTYHPASTNILKSKPATITWTDYIHVKDDKEFTYKINLDDSQATDDAKIKVEFFEAMDKGYVLNKKLTQDLPFANDINLAIPLGQIARISLTTSVKADTNSKDFTYNNQKIINPDHKKEEKTPEKTSEEEQEEEDPLGKTDQETKEEANSTTHKEAENKDSDKEDKKSNSILDQASNKENTKEIEDDSTPDDSEAKDKEIESSKEESKEEAQSAISLNKEAYLQKIDDDSLVKAVNQIEQALEAYNKEETSLKDLKESLANIAKDYKLGAKETEEIIGALLIGLNEENYKVATINPADLTVDIKEATEQEEPKITDAEIKDLIKEEFAKKDAGQITEEELEASLATIREENNIDKEAFFNILADLYKNAEIANDGEENPSEKEELPKIDTEKSKEETLADKLAEEDLSTEDFIRFLKAYVKSYDLEEDQLESLLKENQDEVEKVIGDFTIEEILAAAYLEGLNPHVFAGTNKAILDADFSKESFITELEYSTETLTKATNEQKLLDIVKSNNPGLTDQQIRSDYVGWKINIPGKVKPTNNDITEIKKDKYEYQNMNFSIYAPAGQSLEGYKVVVEDGNGGNTTYSGPMTEKKGDHYVYSFSIPKAQLSEEGYNIYVVAKAEKKRQNYAIGLKIAPDKNYVTEIADNYQEKFEELKKKYPLLIKWIDTSAANPYRNGIELLDTRMVYLEPKGWQDLFPYNEFRSVDYNDNVTDTDIIKNTVSMFGNITEEGQITWTISETFPAEKLVNKNTVGIDAYSAKSDGQSLGNPSVQILVPNNNGGYTVTNLGKNVELATLQNEIGNQPGTIVNYTFKDTAKNKEEFTTLSLDSGKSASIAYKPSLLQREEGAEKDTSGLAYLHKVQEHKDGPGYEVALSSDQAHTMKAFIPSNPSANPRHNDPAFKDTGVVVFCLNPGKPEPTRQYKFNGTITKGEWSTDEKDWAKNGRAIAALATASEAKSSPLYKGSTDDTFYKSLYEYLLRMYWYGQELAEEYQLDEQSYYKIIQYNLYYWIAGENYAESFRNGGGYNTNYFSSAEYSYAQGLKNRISQGIDWKKVNYDEEIQIFYYGHDKTRSYQNTITGDTKRKSKKGSVTVNKVDSQSNAKLSGAAFQLLDANQQLIKTIVTDENGVAVFEDLDYGTYYIKEVQAPKGYQFKEEISQPIEVGENQAHYTFNYRNTKNEIKFRKVNEKGYAMAGVVFELRRNGRSIGQDQTSGPDGKFSWKELTPGSYQVVEKKVSDPLYSENEGRTVASFRVDENNKIQDKVIHYPNGSSKTDIKNEKNECKPIGIEFTKVDLNTKNPLEGAEFVLEYRKPDSSIFRELAGSRRRSNGEGKLVWNDLEDGDYRVIETKAPDGEKYDTEQNLGEKATFTIVKNQNGYYEIESVTPSSKTITNTEKPEKPKENYGKFEFTKVDSEDKKPLQGVEFTLTSEGKVGPKDNKFDYKVSKTTGADGTINYTNLYPGTYTLKETKQLAGYKENTKTWRVEVSQDGSTKVFDENEEELTKKVPMFTFPRNSASISEKAKYIISLSETDQANIVDVNVTIKPQATTNKATIYYVYDDDNNQNLLNNLANTNKVDRIVPIKVNNKDEYMNHIREAYNKNGLSSNSNGILVSYITNDYANELTSYEINTMNSSKKQYVDSSNKPLFAYYKNTSNNLSTIYNNTGARSHGFYKGGVGDNPDFKELIDFINSGALGATDYKLKMNFTYDSSVNVDGETTFYTFFRDGNYLIPGKETTITKKITVKPELINPNSTVNVFQDIKILDSRGSEKMFFENELPGIKVSEDYDPSQGSGSTSDFSISNDKEEPEPANLTIKKVDSETKEGLEGAKFRLYRTEGDARNDRSYLQEVTTNEHGYAVFDSPEIAESTTYYVKEIAAPDGYKITSEITKVTSSKTADNTINAEIPNEKNNARFELYKKGSDGEYLKGVKFKLTNKTTKKSVELETDGNGYLAYDKLKPSTSYELEEIESAQGYTLNNAKATITVDADGKVTVDTNNLAKAKEGEELSLVLVATNIKQASIDFVKQDGASKKALYGAEFVLYKDGKEVTNSLTSSDKDGKFGFDNLEDGSYTVYETASPEGYPYMEEKLVVASFTVKDGKITDLTTNQKIDETSIENFDPNKAYPIYNKINEIKFTKIGKDNQALAGAKFKLDRVWDSYDENGKIQSHRETVLEDIETLDDGIITLSATKAGRYQLIETQAPQGYKQINTKNAAGGQIVAEFTVERATLDIKNITVGNKYIQDMKDYSGDLEIVNKKDVKGKFQVNKVEKRDYNGYIATIPLKGAKFLLKDIESSQYVMTDGTFTRNSGSALTKGDATVNYENLPVGEYELREFEAPDGYVRTINTWKVIVNDDGTTTISENPKFDTDVDAEISNGNTSSPELTLVNKSNEIEFTKIDSKTNKPLAGVEFEIWWDQQGKKNDKDVKYKEYVKIENPDGGTTFKTDAEGKFKLKNLGTGHYKIYETKIPDGYFVEDKPVDNEPIKNATGEFVNEFFVDIDGDIKNNEGGVVDGEGKNLITTIKNTPITGKFRVQKVGEDGVEKLPGAEFKLYKLDKEGNVEGDPKLPTVVKDSEGKTIIGLVEFDDLENGADYLLEETKAPRGYTISSTKWNISVRDGKVNITSKDGSADFTTTDGIITLNVVNKRPSLPSTGGAGTKIAFAIIGTAVMLAGIAYFGIFQNDKNRRRSNR